VRPPTVPGAWSGVVVVVVVVDVVVDVIVVVVGAVVVVEVEVEVSSGFVVVVTLVETVVTGGVASFAESPHPAAMMTNPTERTTTRIDLMDASSRRSCERARRCH